jgi:hypothetical protein
MPRTLGRPLAAMALVMAVATAGAGGAAPAPAAAQPHHAVSPARVALAPARVVRRATRCSSARRQRGSTRARRRRCARRAAAVLSGTPQPLYWGATIGSQLTGTQAPWDMSAVAKFERSAGKPMSIIQLFSAFAECSSGSCSPISFPTAPFEDVRAHGSIPLLSWSSQSIPTSLNEPDYQLSDVASGRYDSYVREFAEQAKAWGHPFFLRFNWEMNGDWFPWAEGVNGNAPGDYVAAWRHVHDVFASVGATNATWVWCPFVDPGGKLAPIDLLYPGDAYVDWSCLDGYNWGANPSHPGGWRSFDQLFSSTYAQITQTVAPSKPMMIAEMGSSEYGGSKAAWIEDALAAIPSRYPQVRAALWFDKFDDGMDWPVETSPAATAAFAQGIQAAPYAANGYAGLGAGTIGPPS